MLHDSHSYYLKLSERPLTFRGFPCGKRVRWLGWSRLTDLAQLHSFRFADERQALIRVVLVRPSVHTPRGVNGRTNYCPLFVRGLFGGRERSPHKRKNA